MTHVNCACLVNLEPFPLTMQDYSDLATPRTPSSLPSCKTHLLHKPPWICTSSCDRVPLVPPTSAGLWSLDNPSDPTTSAVIQDAIQNPDRYVLKPQREGGGNNLYGQELVQQLQQGLAANGGEGLAAYILMQRIVPPPQRSVFVRNGQWQEDESLSELGIYGTFLKVGREVSLVLFWGGGTSVTLH